MNGRPSCFAATATLPLPPNGSSSPQRAGWQQGGMGWADAVGGKGRLIFLSPARPRHCTKGCSWWAQSITFVRLMRVSTPARRQRQPWRRGSRTIAGRCRNCCRFMCRCLAGPHRSSAGVHRMHSNASLRAGARDHGSVQSYQITKPMRKTLSISQDIEGWNAVHEVQIPGTKIEL